jgi:hypothetical protein
MKYILNVTVTGNKAGKFHYTITDETGKVISERKSNREYVAATINGQYYFGRLDLIGKGDHGKQVKFLATHKFNADTKQWEAGVSEQLAIAYKA